MGYYIKQGVNTVLVVGIIIVLVGITIYAVYYQNVFGAVTGNLSVCLERLGVCEQRLAVKSNVLSTTESDLGRLKSLYNNQSLELANTKEALRITTDELNKFRGLYENALEDIKGLKEEIKRMNESIEELLGKVEKFKGRLEACQERLNRCEANLTG